MTTLRDAYVSVISDKSKKNFLTIDDEGYLEEMGDVYSIVHTEELNVEFIRELGLNPEQYVYLSWAQAHLAPVFSEEESAVDIARQSCLYEARFKRNGAKTIYRRLIAVPECYSIDKVLETGHRLYPGVEMHSMKQFSFRNLCKLTKPISPEYKS
ncbi:hypothetical protein [Enterococcus rotai]|uniref:hypothetical protein n=1 Tax=Enterococcus rotai TaxID=118060 RepID=UPI0032B54860